MVSTGVRGDAPRRRASRAEPEPYQNAVQSPAPISTEPRRRDIGGGTAAEPDSAPESRFRLPHRARSNRAYGFAIFLLCCVGLEILWRRRQVTTTGKGEQHVRDMSVLRSGEVAADAEDWLGKGRIPWEDAEPAAFVEGAVACMPSVRRVGAEYVSNAVKSWRLATNGSVDVRRLVVFDMDVEPGRSDWLSRVFDRWDGRLPSWLAVEKRELTAVLEPRKLTHGDSEERVRWRSKEALDYAEVLRRCGELAGGAYVVVVQDDVLFTDQMKNVVAWSAAHMRDYYETHKRTGREVRRKVCGASLADLAMPGAEDAHVLESSQMWARVWDSASVAPLARYIAANFDESPVDWLADARCKKLNRRTIVMEPNPVRHRGAVSSFEPNKRSHTLT